MLKQNTTSPMYNKVSPVYLEAALWWFLKKMSVILPIEFADKCFAEIPFITMTTQSVDPITAQSLKTPPKLCDNNTNKFITVDADL